jgi:DNA ligase (NAD+)
VTVEIRGEVLMTTAQFETANELRTTHGGAPFANPRSGAAGTLRARERAYQVEMTFFGYGALPLPPDDTSGLAARLRELPHSQVMELVAELGVQTTGATPAGLVTAATLDEVRARVGEIGRMRAEGEKAIEFPGVCPRCGSDIDVSQQRWRCVRGRACHALASISYAVGRDRLDIEGLGETRVMQMITAGLVADFAGLFTLTRDRLLTLDRMGQTSTDNLLTAIEQAKSRPLDKVFCALGVRGTGRSVSRRIARHFATMDAIRAADTESIQAVDGIGPEKAAVLVEELAELAPLIDKLVAAGVNMVESGATAPSVSDAGTDTASTAGTAGTAELPLEGMSVVVTGSMTGPLQALSRNQMNELIEPAGGKASSSVSARTSLLVAGEKAGSKKDKATTLGVRIATPAEFATLVGDFL